MGYLRSQIEVVRILCQLLKMILNVHKRVFDLYSHHGDPVRAPQFIAFINSRASRLGCPLRDVFSAISSFTAFH